MPPIDPAQLRQRLDAAVRAETAPSSTSGNKYPRVRELLVELTSLGSVKANTVSKPANLTVRLGQPGAAGGSLGVAVLHDEKLEQEPGEESTAFAERYRRRIEGHIEQAKTAIAKRLQETILICSRRPEDEKWDAVALVGPKNKTVQTLREAFPAATFVEVASESADVIHADPSDLAESLYLDSEWVEDVIWMLRDRKQLVLYGPPGTGKTFIAQRLAAHIQPDPARRSLIQLHPSYAYEDFFEGYRPEVEKGAPTLVRRPGPLKVLAELAADKPTEPVVLVLDEMNRGNLPRIFGELFFLLEYRNRSVNLMYSPEVEFRLPPNLFFVGTMNTADRSIAMLDQALRRRFHFAGLFPDAPPVSGMLRGYLGEHKPDMLWVASLLDEVNRRIGDRNVAVGPSHFMREDLDEVVLGRVWRASVLPTIEEHFYGHPERLAEFALDKLSAQVRAKVSGVDAG